jgi:diguanylate cyclase (GGDEF)-like protein
VPVALSCAPLPADQRAMVVTVLDMSVVRNLHQQLEYQAVTDPLTGLLNRRGFYQAAEGALLRNERSDKAQALMYMDLDGFKRINDCLAMTPATGCCAGWPSSSRTAWATRLLARMGGDEFTALFDGCLPGAGRALCRKLLERLSISQKWMGWRCALG